MGRYWHVLGEHGITRERLASFDRKITTEPFHAPHILGDMRNYLGLLKSVHSATDLGMMIDSARWTLNGDINNRLNDVLAHNSHWDAFSQIRRVTEVRRALPRPGDHNALRDILYLDISLEAYVR
jgi:alpha-glucan,water dikinase